MGNDKDGFDSRWLAPFRFTGLVNPVHQLGEYRDNGGPNYLLGEPVVFLRPDLTITGNILIQDEFVITLTKGVAHLRIDIHKKD